MEFLRQISDKSVKDNFLMIFNLISLGFYPFYVFSKIKFLAYGLQLSLCIRLKGSRRHNCVISILYYIKYMTINVMSVE